MEGFKMLGWDLILPGRRWIYEPKVEVFSGSRFHPRFCKSWTYMYGNSFYPDMGPYPPRVVLAHADSYRFHKKPSASGMDLDIGFGQYDADLVFET